MVLVAVAIAPHDGGAESKAELTRLRNLHRRSEPDSLRALADQMSRRAPFDFAGTARRDLLAIWGQSEASFGRGRFAEPLLREALDLSRNAGDDSTATALLRWLGVAVGLQGRVDEADSIYGELLLAANELESVELRAWAHVGRGWCALQRGALERCVEENRTARSLHAASGCAVGYSWAMNTEAIALRRQGDFMGARALYLETITASQSMDGAAMLHAMALANLGNLEMILGDPARAIESFHRAEAMHRAHRHEREAAVLTLDRAMAFLALAREREALATLDSLRRDCREHGWKDLEASAANEWARAQWRAGRTQAALAVFSKTRRRADIPFRARADAAAAERMVLLDLGQPMEVLKILDDAPRTGEPGVRAQRAVARSRALRDSKQPERARLAILAYTSADSMARLSAPDRLGVLIEAGHACRGCGDEAKALDLFRRAATVWEGYRASASDFRWREQRAAWAAKIFPVLAVTELGATPDRAAKAQLFLRMQSAKARTLMERVRGPWDLRGNTGEVRPPSAVLNRKEVFLDLHLDREEGVLFAVTKDGVRARVVAGAEEWRDRLHRLATLRGRAGDLAVARRALRLSLLGEFSSLVGDSTRVFWCADGPFFASAGEIAPEWTLIPSWFLLSAIRFQRGPARGGVTAHLVGSGHEARLSGAKDEVRWLDDRYQSTTRSNGGLWSGSETAVLHLAGHVEARLDVPWSTSLRLLDGREANGESRVWPAWKIAAGRGAPPLVVLSGCATVSGRELPGEGLSGLAAAFLSAGARSVIATRWPVEDRFAERFIHTLYGELERGQTVGEAVSSARQRHRSKKGQPDSFVVVGDPCLRVELVRAARGTSRR